MDTSPSYVLRSFLLSILKPVVLHMGERAEIYSLMACTKAQLLFPSLPPDSSYPAASEQSKCLTPWLHQWEWRAERSGRKKSQHFSIILISFGVSRTVEWWMDQVRCPKWLCDATKGSYLRSELLLTVQEQLNCPFPAILPRYRDLTQGGGMKLAAYCLQWKWCMTRTEVNTSVLLNVHWVLSRQARSIPMLLLFRKGSQNIPEEEKSVFSWHLNTNKKIPVL